MAYKNGDHVTVVSGGDKGKSFVISYIPSKIMVSGHCDGKAIQVPHAIVRPYSSDEARIARGQPKSEFEEALGDKGYSL